MLAVDFGDPLSIRPGEYRNGIGRFALARLLVGSDRLP
jgi:hypothetical protein